MYLFMGGFVGFFAISPMTCLPLSPTSGRKRRCAYCDLHHLTQLNLVVGCAQSGLVVQLFWHFQRDVAKVNGVNVPCQREGVTLDSVTSSGHLTSASAVPFRVYPPPGRDSSQAVRIQL